MSNEKNKKETSNVNYKGEVRVSVKRGSKTVSTTILKNNGTQPLFLFLANCVNGKYNLAESYRPQYLQLFKTEGEVIFGQSTTWTACTDLVSASDAAEPESEDETSAFSVLNFTVPFSIISDRASVNLLVLKSDFNVNEKDIKSVSAYIQVTPEKLIPPRLVNSEKYNLFVEWKLKFDNLSNENNA